MQPLKSDNGAPGSWCNLNAFAHGKVVDVAVVEHEDIDEDEEAVEPETAAEDEVPGVMLGLLEDDA